MSTKVYLPRFQYEDSPELPVRGRKLAWRAPERAWVDQDEWNQITHPVTVVDKRYSSIRNKGWWGESHHRTIDTSLGQLFESPFDDDPFKLYRTIITRHDYLWDKQAT